MLIFDVGANRGKFTDEYLSTVGNVENVSIVQIEANDQLVEFLEKKYEDNPNIVQNCSLLSNVKDEEVNFFICSDDTISSASIDWVTTSRFGVNSPTPTFRDRNFKWTPKKMITNTLDNLILKYGKPDLLKVDVEGYEGEVLRGLTQKVDEVCFEWSEEEFDKTNVCVEYLKSIGFKSFGYTHEDRPIRPSIYNDWELLDIHRIIQPERQLAWGMIWAK